MLRFHVSVALGICLVHLSDLIFPGVHAALQAQGSPHSGLAAFRHAADRSGGGGLAWTMRVSLVERLRGAQGA